MQAAEYLRARAAAFRQRARSAIAPGKRDWMLSLADYCERMAIDIESDGAVAASAGPLSAAS